MVSAGISLDPIFESNAHPPQQSTHRIEYQNHLALSVAGVGIAAFDLRSEWRAIIA
jgi:hypothetical protein